MTKVVTLNALHENTSGIIRELNLTGESFVLTRRGKILALVSPVPIALQDVPVNEFLARHDLTVHEADTDDTL